MDPAQLLDHPGTWSATITTAVITAYKVAPHLARAVSRGLAILRGKPTKVTPPTNTRLALLEQKVKAQEVEILVSRRRYHGLRGMTAELIGYMRARMDSDSGVHRLDEMLRKLESEDDPGDPPA